MTKKSMRYLAPVLAMSMVLSLTACGGGDTAATTAAAGGDAAAETTAAAGGDTAAAAKDTLIIATANETPSMTTNLHNAVAGDYMNKMTHNGLFLQDENMNIVPDLVESYEIVSDTEWVFKLHQGVKFHNGAEMKAADVVASINQCKESPEVAQYGKAIASIEAVDDYTVKIITDGPQSGLLSDLTHHGNYILPADLIASGHDFNKEPIGTGPYKFVEWKKGESVTLEAFDDYFKGEAPIETVTWKIIPEGSSRTMALEAGEVDLIVEVESTDVSRLKDNASVTVFDGEGTSHNFMMINTEKAPFDNQNFRHAMNAAIDKAAIVQVALNGGGSVCDSQLPTCFPGATTEGASTYDVEKAKEYFAASGLNAADCGFSLICSDDTKLRVGQVIQSSLKEVLGIDIALESMDLATYLDVTATGDYDAAIGGYTSSGMLPYAQGVWHSSSINSSNKTRTNNPEVDALIEKMQATVDPAENEKIVTELNILLNELYPQIPLYMRNNTRAYSADLKGFNVNAGGNTDYSLFSWN
ncbi:MAG: ABC transporter substrate-binding protein [Lachnospiraceae bacterium]|nr:ABC transporter substrate-binding protein [Lachnospiraceae bacterium]